jgi:hypothetical protein
MVQLVVLSASGESRTLKSTAAEVTGLTIAKSLRKTKPAELIGTYTHKAQTLQLWGWKEGKAGTENKHELPPPHDEILLFGDAVVSATTGNFTAEEWTLFYDTAVGGFDEIGSNDSEEEEEEVEDEEVEEVEGDAEDDEEEEEEEEEEGEEEEEAEEEEEEEDGDCYDDGDDAGGAGKRRAPRRRAVTAPEYRRMDMGLKARVKLPAPPGKRAPRWQTAPELEPEAY